MNIAEFILGHGDSGRKSTWELAKGPEKVTAWGGSRSPMPGSRWCPLSDTAALGGDVLPAEVEAQASPRSTWAMPQVFVAQRCQGLVGRDVPSVGSSGGGCCCVTQSGKQFCLPATRCKQFVLHLDW